MIQVDFVLAWKTQVTYRSLQLQQVPRTASESSELVRKAMRAQEPEPDPKSSAEALGFPRGY